MTGFKRTKIIATLGPATDDLGVLDHMIANGLNLVRVNFSHGEINDHKTRIESLRARAAIANREIGVLADLQGPKIRLGAFATPPVNLEQDNPFIIDLECPIDAGDVHKVGIRYKALLQDVSVGSTLLVDDGRLELEVIEKSNTTITTKIIVGGLLHNHKGINLRGGGLSAPALTDKDKEDIKTAVALDADYIAVSFVETAQDIHQARALIEQAGGQASIIAKIERKTALSHIDDIINVADAIMVARGDLGVEINTAEIPAVQKTIIQKVRAADKTVITATQMMDSMISNIHPTRAEVSDVANAIVDGTDAVMLSAETATGNHPDLVIQTMNEICLGAEKNPTTQSSGHRVECTFTRTDESIAMATMYIANHFDIKAIIALTESGSTPLWMSRIRSGITIFGLSRTINTLRKMTLFRGVIPILFDPTEHPHTMVGKRAIEHMVSLTYLQAGDKVIITHGDELGTMGGTNSLRIVEVTDP